MDIFIRRDGTEYGPYQQSDVERMLASGELLKSDLARCEALANWVTLSSLIVRPTEPTVAVLKPTKRKRNWRAGLMNCATLLGCGLLAFGSWRSCSAKNSWMLKELSYEDYRDTENSMLFVMLAGLMLIVPSGLALLRRKKNEVNRELKKAEEFNRKVLQDPAHCPNCGSDEFDTYCPSKPQLWTPASFSGIVLGAAANSMADAMFKPERICIHCRCRWPAPHA